MKTWTRCFFGSVTMITAAPLLRAAPSNVEATVQAPQTQAGADTANGAAQPAALHANQEMGSGKLSFGLDDVVKLVKSGVGSEVVLTYINNSLVPYSLTATDVIHLHELGVPSEITAAAIRHGGQLRAQQAAVNKANQASNAQQPTPPTPYSAPVAMPPPAAPLYNNPGYVYPDVDYFYPTYSYVAYPSFDFSYSVPFYFGHYRYPYHYYRGFAHYPYPRTIRGGLWALVGSGHFPRVSAGFSGRGRRGR